MPGTHPHALRASGRIPAVVYGAEKGKAVEIAVDPKTLLRILHSESGVNTLIGLQLDGGDTRVLVKEYQVDPIDHKLLHADFYQVAMDKTITVTVPVILKGEAKGVKQAQLSRDTAIPKSTISEILAGKKPFSRAMIRKLADYFNVDASVLAVNF